MDPLGVHGSKTKYTKHLPQADDNWLRQKVKLHGQKLIVDYSNFLGRDPDFLLDILQRQETNQAMPWLADLVESSEGSFHVLPVQCLCEFLLDSTAAIAAAAARDKIQ